MSNIDRKIMNSIDPQYQALLKDIMLNGIKKKDRTGTGTISVFGRQIRHDMKEGFPLLTTKKMYWKGIVAELLWFLRGDTNIKFLIDNNCHIWDGDAFKNYLNKYKGNFEMDKDEFINAIKTNPEFATEYGNLGPIYGAQWRNWTKFEYQYGNIIGNLSIDQIINLIDELKTNPDSRRLMVNAWNVAELDQMVLPPCHYGFQCYTRELSAKERTALGSKGSTRLYDSIKESNYPTINADVEMHKVCDAYNVPRRALSLMWSQRSVDIFLGLPFNIASYGLLLSILAELTNMIPDQLIGNLGDVHLYQNHWNQANEQFRRSSYDLPKLIINTEFWNPENSLGENNWVGIIEGMQIDDFQIENYISQGPIKAPLSN